MYPEFVLSPEERKAFLTDRTGALVGRKLADQYGWKVGDHDPAARDDLSGHLDVHAARHLRRRRAVDRRSRRCSSTGTTSTRSIKRLYPRRADQTGVFVVGLAGSGKGGGGVAAIDASSANSLAETLTETEKAFQLGFVAMTEAILLAIQAVSFVVIVIIMAVMANTMAMTARERSARVRDAEGAGILRRLRRRR